MLEISLVPALRKAGIFVVPAFQFCYLLYYKIPAGCNTFSMVALF